MGGSRTTVLVVLVASLALAPALPASVVGATQILGEELTPPRNLETRGDAHGDDRRSAYLTVENGTDAELWLVPNAATREFDDLIFVHELEVAWTKAPVAGDQVLAWNVTVHGETAEGTVLHLEGTWTAAAVTMQVCTASIPPYCSTWARGPVTLVGSFGDWNLTLAGVAEDRYCATSSSPVVVVPLERCG